jgi:hypothetical protein
MNALGAKFGATLNDELCVACRYQRLAPESSFNTARKFGGADARFGAR